MRAELQEIENIEKYVFRKQSPQERASFESRLLWDKDFKKAMEIQQKIYLHLKISGRKKLRKELDLIHDKLYDTKKKYRLIGQSIFLFGILGYILYHLLSLIY